MNEGWCVDGVWCSENSAKQQNEKETLKHENWSQDFVGCVKSCGGKKGVVCLVPVAVALHGNTKFRGVVFCQNCRVLGNPALTPSFGPQKNDELGSYPTAL